MTVIAPTEPHGTQTPTVVPPSRSPRVRVAWTVAGLVVAIAIIPALALTLIGSAAYQPLPARQRVFTVPITAVTVETSSGNITVERGTGVGTVVRTSGVHGLTDPTDVEHVVGHTLVIRSSCGSMFFNDRCSRNYVLQLPSAAAVTAESTQGDVTDRRNGTIGVGPFRSGRRDGRYGWHGHGAGIERARKCHHLPIGCHVGVRHFWSR